MRRLVSAIALAASVAIMLTLAIRPVSAHVVPSPCDFTTGGGWIIILEEGGDQANFGIVAGCKNGGFYGDVNYVDHNFGPPGFHVRSTSIDGYFDPIPSGSTYRDICGTASTNVYGDVKFRVRTQDNGEPGANDRFGIKLMQNGTVVYLVTTRQLGPTDANGGGNIQLHNPNPSTTGPAVPPFDFVVCGGDDSGLGF
ncbi:MAG: hypothetical protein HY047_15025 [Acidobacteria bacterium]|nr:hypothetical protein [Acidobacteriota bacterium]